MAGGRERIIVTPKPYYDEDGITIYCGDNREIIPHLEGFDLLLTDPPYGIGRDGSKMSTSSHGGRKPYEFAGWDSEAPPSETFEKLFNRSRHQVIWGGNYFTRQLPPKMGWLVWDKGQNIDSSDCELAFCSRDGALRRKVLNRVELMADGAVHPTQKPLSLMSWCLSFFPDARTVLDPFCGSGTTLVAAKLRGLKATGIEINEDYCRIAVERLRQGVLLTA